jgi:hypothetical protein
MKKIGRIIFALAIFLSGATLVPALGLPAQGFNWQHYENVYATIKLFIPVIVR